MEEQALRPFGLTHAGYRILCELWVNGPSEPRKLAGFMLVTRASIVGAINTLVSNGLVERRRSTEDRRLVTVDLTKSGRDAVERADAACHQAQVEVLGRVPRQEQRELARLAQSAGAGARQLRTSESSTTG